MKKTKKPSTRGFIALYKKDDDKYVKIMDSAEMNSLINKIAFMEEIDSGKRIG